MCLAAVALQAHPRYALVVAANRDEFFQRPSAALDWWTPPGASAPILAGRDLQAGGTWMGLNASGRLAIVTNVREGIAAPPSGPSRGAIVPAWLQHSPPTGAEAADLVKQLIDAGHAPFNLLALDLAAAPARALWLSNRAPGPVDLAPGVHALSNAASLQADWPKVRQLRAGVEAALRDTAAPAAGAARTAPSEAPEEAAGEHDAEALAQRLFGLLADPRQADDADLPATGVPLEWERRLSAAFIRSVDGHYGTRCSTVVVGERHGQGLRLRVWERSFDARGEPAGERHHRLDAWPSP